MSSVSERLAAFAPSDQSFFGYLFWLSRPRFWLYLAGPVAVGVVYAADSVAGFFQPLALLLFAWFLVPANLFLYGVNDIFDVDIDENNPKKGEGGREVQYTGDGIVVMTVYFAGAVGTLFGFALTVEGIYALAAFYVLAVEYSAPPLRLKTTPVLDSLSNGLYVLPGVVAYIAIAGESPPLLAVAGGWLWTMGMHTFSAVPDIEPDRAAGIDTTATVLGERWTLVYCGVVWLAAATLMGLLHPFLGVAFGIYPVLTALFALSTVSVDRAYWWFPIINTVAGAVLTVGGVWVVIYG
jgi:4-hydroxybenzoate polyprenyltransferase and related prenyltransferases